MRVRAADPHPDPLVQRQGTGVRVRRQRARAAPGAGEPGERLVQQGAGDAAVPVVPVYRELVHEPVVAAGVQGERRRPERLGRSGEQVMTGQAALLARSESLKLVLPECSKGIGSVITSPDSSKLIEGVRIQPIALWPDDRGYFLEVQRIGHGLAAHFPPATSQISAAEVSTW